MKARSSPWPRRVRIGAGVLLGVLVGFLTLMGTQPIAVLLGITFPSPLPRFSGLLGPPVCERLSTQECGPDGVCQLHARGCEAVCVTPPCYACDPILECGPWRGVPVGNPCGPGKNESCVAGAFCKYPEETQCGRAGKGACVMPGVASTCAFAARGAPVCGCDGKTYAGWCEAQMASVSVRAQGRCGGSK